MLCHVPFLLPLVGLILFGLLPFPAALGLYAGLTLVSLAIGIPSVRALVQPVLTGAEGMQGKTAVVVTADGWSGTVRCEGELWRCRSRAPVEAGARVRIVRLDGLTALVEPVHSPSGQASRARQALPSALAVLLLELGWGAPAAAQPARLHVTTLGEHRVPVLDGRPSQVLRAFPTARDPHFMVAAPDGRRLYVTMGRRGMGPGRSH